MRMLRRLNDRGIVRWKAWLDGGATGEPPRYLLHDPETSTDVTPPVAILPKTFGTRFEFGRYLEELLRPVDAAQIRFDAGLWDALTLHFVDVVYPAGAAAVRKPMEIVRLAFAADSYQKRTRHLVRTAWLLVSQHGEHARFMLSGPPDVHGDVVEQLSNRQEVIGSKALIAAAAAMWWDEAGQTHRRGITNRNPRKGGTVRRLIDVARQFRLTWDLDSMTPEQIVNLLPSEFDRWKRPASGSGSFKVGHKPPPGMLARILGRS